MTHRLINEFKENKSLEFSDMNQMNMIGCPAVNSFQYQIKETDPVKMVYDYPEELDIWLEEHIADVEEQGVMPTTVPTSTAQAIQAPVGSFILQQGSQGGFLLQQGTAGGMVMQQGPLLLQQGSGQQVFLQQQSGGGMVVHVPQQSALEQQPSQPPQQIQVQRFQQPVQQTQQVRHLVQPSQQVHSTQQVHLQVQATQQAKPHVQHSQQVQQTQVQHLVQPVQKMVQPQETQVVNSVVLEEQDPLPRVEEVVKPKFPEGKVVVYNEMPDVPNAKKGPDGKYPCDQCEYKATRQWNLKKHKLSVHEGVKYGCDECDYKATDQSQVKKHKRSKHGTEIKNILC